VTESAKEMGQEVKERAIYMFVVVYRMFQRAHDKFLDRVASVQTSRQPYVLKYVVDALMEDGEAEDVKTVIDALDQKSMR
jgi:hypothetical protein